jgi:hypothetical protein
VNNDKGNFMNATCPNGVCPSFDTQKTAIDYNSQLRTWTLVSDVAFGVGLASLAASAYFLLTSRAPGRDAATATTTLVPSLSQTGASVGLLRLF